MTRRYNYIWGFNNINEFDATYTNNRQDATNEEALTYDDSGRVTKVDYRLNQNPLTKYMTSKFDARGIYIESLNREITGGGGSTYIDKQFTVAQTFDTDGQRTKRVETDYVYSSLQGTTNDVKTDYLRSYNKDVGWMVSSVGTGSDYRNKIGDSGMTWN